MESDAVIKEITAGKGLRLTQKAQNLTIYNLGTSYSSAGQTGEKFDDVDINVTAKVVNTKGNMAGIEFVDMPDDVANKILYRYMQQADSMKSNLTTSSI